VEWWERLGGFAMGISDSPALAVDMSLHGPQSDFGYTLTALMNRTTAPLDTYPPDELGG
jgi:hypothetical protein